MRDLVNAFRDRWSNVHPFPKFLVTVAVIFSGAILLMFPAKTILYQWRLDRMRTDAVAAFSAGDMERTRELAMDAILSGAGEIEMFRLLEVSMEALSDHRHRSLAQVVYEHAEATDEDRLRTFRLLCEVKPMGALGGMWMRLPERLRLDVEFAMAFTDAQLEEGLHAEAAAVLLVIPEDARTDAIWQQLIRVMLCEGSDGVLAVAFQWLAQAWPERVAEDGGWYEVLEEIPVEAIDPEALAPVRLKLRAAGAEESARGALALARLEWAARVFQREALVREMVERWKLTAHGHLARFLVDVESDRELLAAIPDGAVGVDRELLRNLLVAARRTGSWDRFEGLLEMHAGLLPDWERVAHLAVMGIGKGTVGEESTEVLAVLREAALSRDDRAFIGQHRIFAAAGLKVAAHQALLEAMMRGRGRLPLYHQIRPVTEELMAQKRDDVLLRIYRHYLDFEPSEPQLAARFLYLVLLREVFTPEMVAERLELMAQWHPNHYEIQHYMAAAWLSAGHPRSAARAMESVDPVHQWRRVMDVDWETAGALETSSPLTDDVPARLRAIRLATRVANGGIPTDDPRVLAFPIGELLVTEVREFKDWLALGEDG